MFDYNALQRLNVSVSDLRLNSVFINREIPIIVQYKNELIATAIVFFVLLILLFLLASSVIVSAALDTAGSLMELRKGAAQLCHGKAPARPPVKKFSDKDLPGVSGRRRS